MIGGSVPADDGTVSFVGTTLGGLSPQQRTALGLVRTFQVPRPFSQLTVRDNLAVAAPGNTESGLPEGTPYLQRV